MKTLIALALAFSVSSNVWLWVNLWNLKTEHFRFREDTIALLKELCEQPTENCPGESAEKTTDKV